MIKLALIASLAALICGADVAQAQQATEKPAVPGSGVTTPIKHFNYMFAMRVIGKDGKDVYNRYSQVESGINFPETFRDGDETLFNIDGTNYQIKIDKVIKNYTFNSDTIVLLYSIIATVR